MCPWCGQESGHMFGDFILCNCRRWYRKDEAIGYTLIDRDIDANNDLVHLWAKFHEADSVQWHSEEGHEWAR